MRPIILNPTELGSPRTQPIRQIIIHSMAEYLYTEDGVHLHATEFLKSIGLSCDYMVTPGGDTIQCNMDPLKQYCWHAKGFNDDSIGIEVLVPGLWTYPDFKKAIHEDGWVSSPAFTEVINLTFDLCKVHNLTADDVYPHYKRDNRGIKKDPGRGFDWQNFKLNVQSRL